MSSTDKRARRTMTEREALAMLRRYSRVQWGTHAFSWTISGVLMMLFQRFFLDRDWTAAVITGVLFAVGAMTVYIAFDWWRVKRLPDTSGWTSLERAEVIARDGARLTLRGAQSTVIAPFHSAWQSGEGDPVWVGPRLQAGVEPVLIRAAGGPFVNPVLSSRGPAEPA